MWAIGEADFYSMPSDLRACIRWYGRTDLNNWRKAEQAIHELLEIKHAQGIEGAFDWVESHNEAWLRLEAFINERCDIPGITLRDIDILKKKSVMKRIFQEARLRVARGAVVSTTGDAVQPGRGDRVSRHPQAERRRRRRRHLSGGRAGAIGGHLSDPARGLHLGRVRRSAHRHLRRSHRRPRQDRFRKHADLRRRPDRIRPGQRYVFLCRPAGAARPGENRTRRWSRGSASAGSFFTSSFLRSTGNMHRSRSTAGHRAGRSST